MSEASTENKLRIAQGKKDDGNAAFKSGQYKDALRFYYEAILYVQGLEKSLSSAMDSNISGGSGSGADEKRRPKTEADVLLVALYNNMAAVHLKLANWKRAFESAEKALSRDEENSKAGFRKSQALVQMGERVKAIKLLEELAKTHPNDVDITRELSTQKQNEEKSEREHDKVFKEAWKGKLS
ncbi:TPR-like protein [Dacryopinax primogenitus]|uniref:TPR-like protein n=1 Tax=Dacryopinax primogenitus (strain DJM 731) TaxID=1858805 RepID=M5G958_DACPD|nr:TPR-like protein [Dacryopinax primogenitus]EJU04715.1 TPR-like protein [Dacryopinax primogenitus]